MQAGTTQPTATQAQRALVDRHRTLLDAVDILQRIFPQDDLLGPIRTALEALDLEIVRVAAGVSTEAQDARIAAQLERIEHATLAADATIPMLPFRSRVDVDALPRDGAERYAIFLARHLGGDTDRRDRVDLLVTRLVSEDDGQGGRRMRDRSRVAAFLRMLGADAGLQPASRAASVRFLEAQRARVEAAESMDALFEDGLYANVYGHKVALGQGFLDPDVLWASSELNVAIGNRVSFERAFLGRAVLTEYDVREVLTADVDEAPVERAPTPTPRPTRPPAGGGLSTDPETLARFDRSRARGREEARVGRVVLVDPAPRWPGAVRWGLLVVLVGVALRLLGGGGSAGMAPVPAASLDALSTYLVSGEAGGEDGRRIFVGALDAERWASLGPEGRGAELASLEDRLRADGFASALVTAGGRIALELQAGRRLQGEAGE